MKKNFLLIVALFVIQNAFSQTNYYQAIVYFLSGVNRNVTSTDTSATVFASDVQTVLNKYSITANMIYPAFAEFKEADTLLLHLSKLASLIV